MCLRPTSRIACPTSPALSYRSFGISSRRRPVLSRDHSVTETVGAFRFGRNISRSRTILETVYIIDARSALGQHHDITCHSIRSLLRCIISACFFSFAQSQSRKSHPMNVANSEITWNMKDRWFRIGIIGTRSSTTTE